MRLKLLALCALCIGGLREQLCTANVETTAGSHKVLTLRADAAHAHRHLLVKSGSDERHAAVAGAADYPIGSTFDSPAAVEDIFNVHPLNDGDRTRALRAATALAAGTDVYTAADGFVQALPAAPGTFYRVGRTVAAAAQESGGNYVVEVTPCAPVKTIIIAAATGTAATDIAALYVALQSGPAEIHAL